MGNLANPTIVVDDNTIQIKPNSLSFKMGRGEASVRSQQAGNGVTVLTNINSETKLSMVKFTMLYTQDAEGLIEDWLSRRESGGSTIEFFDGDVRKSFSRMVIVTEPERSTGAEGEVEVEFQGPPGA